MPISSAFVTLNPRTCFIPSLYSYKARAQQRFSPMDLYGQVTDLLSNPKHNKWLSPLLLALEALLCTLIIWKVPCEISLARLTSFTTPSLTHPHRHGNRLASLHATSGAISRRRARLHAHQGRHRPARLPGRARLLLHRAVPRYGPGEEYRPCAGDVCWFICVGSGGCDGLL